MNTPRSLDALLAPWWQGPVPPPALAVHELTLDTREVRPGSVYFALQGTRQHGLQHAAAAVAAGAVAIVYDPAGAPAGIDPGVPMLGLPDLRERLGLIAARYFGEPARALTVIGVTGTNGKTSTVQLVAAAMTAAGHRCASLGTLGGGLWPALEAGARTTPDAIAVMRFFARMRDAGATHVAMEVSSHALEQGRVNGVPFAVAVYTNLTRDHLDYHGSMAAYAAAKARLFAWPTLRHAVLNLDDPVVAEVAPALADSVELIGCRLRSVGEAALRGSALHCHADGLSLALQLDGLPGPELHSTLLGAFNASNLLGVLGVLRALGIPPVRWPTLVAGLRPVDGRMNRVNDPGQPLVVVDYAHTPDALEQALQATRQHTLGSLGVVFGCGGERDAGKRPQMGAVAERLADWVILTDDNPRGEDGAQILAQIAGGMTRAPLAQVRDRRAAIAQGLARLGVQDALLIAGKGHETYQEIGGQCLPFSDHAVARAGLEARAA